MLYFILSIVIRIALKIFFRQIRIRGKENVPASGPIIVVGNHPNTFMDPILAALVMLPRQVHFLANGSIFKTAVARLVLDQFNTIPVYRKQDVTENREEKNFEAFQKCFDFLGTGGILLIFPEGNSINERKLRPIRTGVARIALGTQRQYDFNLPLNILPVGLNYANPTRFGEEVLINIGKPFGVDEYRDLYLNDPAAAIGQLTAKVQEQLTSLIVVTDDAEEDDLVRKIEVIYKRQIRADARTKGVHVNLTRNIVQAVNYFQENNPKLVREVKEKIDSYFQTIKEYNLSDYLVEKSQPVSTGKLVRYVLYFVTGMPAYLAGLFFNYIPYIIPAKIANWISGDQEYRAPIMMTAGIFTFPLYYALMYVLAWKIYPGPYIMAALTLVMPVSGFFVLQYYKRLKNSRSTFAYYSLFRRKRDALEWFTQQRQEIIHLLEGARDQFPQPA